MECRRETANGCGPEAAHLSEIRMLCWCVLETAQYGGLMDGNASCLMDGPNVREADVVPYVPQSGLVCQCVGLQLGCSSEASCGEESSMEARKAATSCEGGDRIQST